MHSEALAQALNIKVGQLEAENEAMLEQHDHYVLFVEQGRGDDLLRQMAEAYEERDDYKYNDAMKELHDHIGCSAFPPYVTTNKE